MCGWRIFHKWSKWRWLDCHRGSEEFTRQVRECEVCGLTETRSV